MISNSSQRERKREHSPDERKKEHHESVWALHEPLQQVVESPVAQEAENLGLLCWGRIEQRLW